MSIQTGTRVQIGGDHAHAGKKAVVVGPFTRRPDWHWEVELEPPHPKCPGCITAAKKRAADPWTLEGCPTHGEYPGHRCAVREDHIRPL